MRIVIIVVEFLFVLAVMFYNFQMKTEMDKEAILFSKLLEVNNKLMLDAENCVTGFTKEHKPK